MTVVNVRTELRSPPAVSYVGSYIWSIRQHVGNRVLLVPGAQVLLLDEGGRGFFQRRTDNGVWELPAGSCEEGSTFARTAVQELAEETGLRVEEADLVPFGTLSDPDVHLLAYPNGDRTHCFALCFLARRWSGELRPEPEEVTATSFHDLADPPQPLHRPTSVVLEMHREFEAGGGFQAR
jgi:8-oxo-dGTP pyrophosphatase MutT (NUDIX family)